MARYMVFEKTRNYNYKFKGTSSGTSPSMAIKKMKARGTPISSKSIFIAVPIGQFMKYQVNPKTTKGKMGTVTTWAKP